MKSDPTPQPGRDYYTDELGRVVFTAEYHLRRGYCCGNGCRHCPFRSTTHGDDHLTCGSHPAADT